jgi:hypothetical protein
MDRTGKTYRLNTQIGPKQTKFGGNCEFAVEERSRMKRRITEFKLNSTKLPKSDWRAFDAMSEKERHQAANSDADAPPASAAQLARAQRLRRRRNSLS